MRSFQLKPTVLIVGCALLVVVLAVIGIHSPRRSVASAAAPSTGTIPTTGESADAAGSGTVIRFVKDPEPAPALEAKDLTGKLISSADWKGKVVILDFWATWCVPCRIEIPILKSLQQRYRDRLQIIGISVDDDPPAAVLAFTKQQGINYPVTMTTPELNKFYGGDSAVPTAYIIDTQGRIVQKHVGVYSEDAYDLEIRALLGMAIDARVETFVDQGQVMLKNAARATSLPGVSFDGLTASQKREALHRLNNENCTCGCNMTIAQCRVDDEACPVSLKLAAQVIQDVKDGKPDPPPAASGGKP